MKKISILQFPIYFVMLIILNACGGGDGNVQNNQNQTVTKVPVPLQKLNVDRNALKAYITLDGSPDRIEMLIDSTGDGTASVVLPGLTRSLHNIVIFYEYTDATGSLILAEYRNSIDLTSGSQNLNVAVNDYVFDFDEDGDNVNNITELLEGTNPRLQETGVLGVQLIVIADVPELSVAAQSAGTLRAFVTLDGSNVQINMIIDAQTGKATVSIPNLSQAPHEFTVTFEYTDIGGALTLATITDIADLTLRGGEFSVVSTNYETLRYDNDADGTSNALELFTGSDPRVKNIPVVAATLNLQFNVVKTFSFSWADVEGATFYRLLEKIDNASSFVQLDADIPIGQQSINHVLSLLVHLNANYILQSCNDSGCIDGSIVLVKGALDQSVLNLSLSGTDSGDMSIRAKSTNLTEVSMFSRVVDNFSLIGIAKKRIYGRDREGLGFFPDGDFFGGGKNQLSKDGSTLVVSAILDDNDASGIESLSTEILDSGVIYVFGRIGNDWVEQAYIKEVKPKAFNAFGNKVTLSGNGDTLAFIAQGCNDYSNIGGVPVNPTVLDSQSAYVYVRDINNTWSLQSCIKASNDSGTDLFGGIGSGGVEIDSNAVNFLLSDDGRTLIVSAAGEDSSATGIQQGVIIDNNLAVDSGAVYVFVSDGTTWSQQAYIKASNTDAGDGFGERIALSSNGNVLVVAALGEDSGSRSNQADNTSLDAGAVYVFERTGNNWVQQDYIKPDNIDAIGSFGGTLSLNVAADLLAIGDLNENSDSPGVNGDATNKNHDSGAVYVFERNNKWNQKLRIKDNTPITGGGFGAGILSDDGSTLIVNGTLLY